MDTETTKTATKGKKAAAETTTGALGRRKLRALGRKKRAAKLVAEPEFKKAFFEAKSKRSTEKKAAFRKKKKGKK